MRTIIILLGVIPLTLLSNFSAITENRVFPGLGPSGTVTMVAPVALSLYKSYILRSLLAS